MDSSTSELEKRLWRVCDSLRPAMATNDSARLILALIFLCHADRQFSFAEAKFKKNGGQVELDNETCCTLGCIYLHPQGRLSKLLEVQPHDASDAVNRAMMLLESENEYLQGLFPRVHGRVDGYLLLEVLRAISEFPTEANGLATVFEAFLHRFIRSEGQTAGCVCLPDELTRLMFHLVKPQVGMRVYDPCAAFGDTLLAAVRYVAGNDLPDGQPLLFGEERNAEAHAVCVMRMLINGVGPTRILPGNALTSPRHLVDGRLATFDRVVSYPPFSLSPWHHGEADGDPFGRFNYGIPPKSSGDYAFIQHILASTSPQGMAAVLVTHGALFRGGSAGRIRQAIVESDFVEAVIGLPAGLLYGTSIPVAILVLNRNKPKGRTEKVLFVDAGRDFVKQNRHNSLCADDVAKVVTTFEAFSDVEGYARVVDLDEIRNNAFNLNIQRYADSSPLAALLTEYSQYEKFAFKELSTEINSISGNDVFQDKPNAVYVPVAHAKRATSSLEQIEGHHRSFYQIVLGEKALSEYVAQFLRSSIGRHSLSALAQGSSIKRISKSDLSECMIAVPSPSVQRQIISTHHKLDTLKHAIGRIDAELSLNPTMQTTFYTQVDDMLEAINKLSDADHVRRIVREGESNTVEFKEVFTREVKDKESSERRDKREEQPFHTEALKTIVAFLNSDGGHLLIGVRDGKKAGGESLIVGVDEEIRKFRKNSIDEFLLHFTHLLRDRIGGEYVPFIEYRLYDVEGRNIFVVKCGSSNRACYLDAREFWIRTGPASCRLQGPEVQAYIAHQFSATTWQ